VRFAVSLVLLLSIANLLTPEASSSRTWYIAPTGSGDAPTIQAGIDSAAAGDTLLLADGTYASVGNRDINYLGKAITVTSQSGDPDLCIIDAGNHARGFVFSSGEDRGSELDGVSITNGSKYDNGYGGGILCSASSPTIRNTVLFWNNASGGGGLTCDSGACPMIEHVTFIQNAAWGLTGGGMLCKGGSAPILTDVTFIENDAGYYGAGGGLSCIEGSSPTLTDVRFLSNYGPLKGGGIYCNESSPILVEVVFHGNKSTCSSPPFPTGGGVDCYNSSPSLTNCVFFDNRAFLGGALACRAASHPTLANVTFSGNGASYGGGLYFEDSSPLLENVIIASSRLGEAVYCYGSSSPILTCCNIHDNIGGDWVGCIADQFSVDGNFSADPRFCDAPNGDFSLEDCSPCLPGYHPDGYGCDLIGALGSGCSCDSSATTPVSWGAIKSMYR
jgi:predicted outer membrane repeat protein